MTDGETHVWAKVYVKVLTYAMSGGADAPHHIAAEREANRALKAYRRATKKPGSQKGPAGALHVACPTCGARPGVKCVGAMFGASHTARFDEADRVDDERAEGQG